MFSKAIIFPATLLCALSLAACNSSGPAPVQQVSTPVAQNSRPRLVSDPNFKLPEGSGCSGAVNRYRAIMDNDLETGHTTKSVHDQIIGEIDQAASACAAGNDAGARGMISASRSRHGYPAS